MEKVERAQVEPVAPPVSPEQLSLAKEAIDQVSGIQSVAELKMFYTGAQEAGLLSIKVDGKTLNSTISARKKELEAVKWELTSLALRQTAYLSTHSFITM